MSVKTLRVSRQGGAAFNTMKNTQIKVGQDGFEPPTSRLTRAL